MIKLVLAVSMVLVLFGCGSVPIPPCILDGSCLPSPRPSPVPSASPSAPPVTTTTSTSTTSTTSTTTTTSTSLLPSPPPTTECFTPCPAFPALQCPCENTCPASFDHAASRVGIGQEPAVNRQTATRTQITLSASSKDVPPWVPHRGNPPEAEQWEPCARAQDRKGFPPIVWYAAYAGTGCNINSMNEQDCQIEHASRTCDPAEKQEDARNGACPSADECNSCRRPNGWSFRDIVGEGGGAPGARKVCALPSSYRPALRRAAPFSYDSYTRTAGGGFKLKVTPKTRRVSRAGTLPSCRTWEFTLSGARLLE